MTNIGGVGGIEQWIKDHTRKMRTVEQGMPKLRILRQTTSTTRPQPSSQQPGAQFFETDTNKTITVNAAQTGYVTRGGNVDDSFTREVVQRTTLGTGGTPSYYRLLAMDGNSNVQGANTQLLVSGAGDYGTPLRNTALISLASRAGTTSAHVNNLDNASSATYYWRQPSTFVTELWVLTAAFQYPISVTILDYQSPGAGGVIGPDSGSTTPPTGLNAMTIVPTPAAKQALIYGPNVATRGSQYSNVAVLNAATTHVEFQVTTSAALTNTQMVQLPAVPMYPPIDQFITCSYLPSGGSWTTGSCYVTSDGWVRPLNFTPAAGMTIGGTGSFTHN